MVVLLVIFLCGTENIMIQVHLKKKKKILYCQAVDIPWFSLGSDIIFLKFLSFKLISVLSIPAGSVPAEEEHDRVSWGIEHSHTGYARADGWLVARHRLWSRQLEEPSRQPLQWLFQLQRRSSILRQGKPVTASSSSTNSSVSWARNWKK